MSFGEYGNNYIISIQLEQEMKISEQTASKITKLIAKQNCLENSITSEENSAKIDYINKQLSKEFREFF